MIVKIARKSSEVPKCSIGHAISRQIYLLIIYNEYHSRDVTLSDVSFFLSNIFFATWKHCLVDKLHFDYVYIDKSAYNNIIKSCYPIAVLYYEGNVYSERQWKFQLVLMCVFEKTCIFNVESRMCLQSCQDAIWRYILRSIVFTEIYTIRKRDTNYVLSYPLSDFL